MLHRLPAAGLWCGCASQHRGERLCIQTGAPSVNSVVFSPGVSLVISGSGAGDKLAMIWNALNGEKWTTSRHRTPINFAAFLPDGEQAAAGLKVDRASQDTRTVRIWGIPKDWEGNEFDTDGARCVAPSPERNWIVSSPDNGVGRIWCSSTGV